MKTALASIAIGKRYTDLFERHSRRSFENYARRHGYDFLLFTREFRHLPGRSPAWQKLFLLEQPELADFERIVFVDSDIIISPAAPAIGDFVPRGRVGFVPEIPVFQSIPDWYQAFDLPVHDVIVQTGVLCLEPDHAPLLQKTLAYPETPLFEMPALSHVVCEANVGHAVDSRFNALVYPELLRKLPRWMIANKPIKEVCWKLGYPPMRKAYAKFSAENWFLHAAGAKRDLARIAPPTA